MYIDELNHRYSTYSLINKAQSKPPAKPSILSHLSQKKLPFARDVKLRWLVGISCVPLFGIVTAFGLAPKATPAQIAGANISHSIETIALPSATTQGVNEQMFVFSDRVKKNDTLQSVLTRLQVKDNHAAQFFKSNALPLAHEHQLKRGQKLSATVDADGHLANLNYRFNTDEGVYIQQSDDHQLTAKKIKIPVEMRQVFKSATITHSLFASTDLADIPDSVAMQMIKIFESQIDFHREIQKGDSFKVIYQAGFHQGEHVKTGEILAVEFINKRKKHIAIGYPDRKGKIRYFTPKGNSLGKTFLRSPLEFTRITSGFSRGRYHPVLQRIRAHKGVDMAAPTGTKIRASGDAVVSYAGWKGGYGRVVILKHAHGVKTVYGHLSRFAKKLKKGRVVKQSQIIGYVGQSGLATGPHLHYEFLKNGKHQDPMKVALPKSTHISRVAKNQFLRQSRTMLTRLKLLDHTNIAALQ